MTYATYATYAIYVLCGLSVLQSVTLIVLFKRRRDLDLSRIEARLSHFAEALALLTDTTQSGFTSVAAELQRHSDRRAPAASRAVTSKRIVTAARKGRSIQDIAAAEEVSESEIRLTLGLAEDLMDVPAASAPAAKPRAARVPTTARVSRLEIPPAEPAPASLAHETSGRPRNTRRVGNTLNIGA